MRRGRNRRWHSCRRHSYRSRNGRILGVCRGLAESFDVSVFWVRFGVVMLMVFTGFWPVVILYLVAAAIMRLEPVVPFSSDSDQEFYNSYSASRKMALARLKNKFQNLDRRIRRMEDVVTSKDYEWNSKFHSSGGK